MKWTAPPSRREIQILVFAFCVFLFACNLDDTLQFFGLDPATTHGTVLRILGFWNSKVIATDGRRPPGWRDFLENEIFGTWAWEEDEVSGDGALRSQGVGEGKHGAGWLGRKGVGALRGGSLGDLTVNDGFLRWGEDIPKSRLVRHISGYSILDNIIICNKIVYVVSDDPDEFPSMKSIVSALGLGMDEWKLVSSEEAREELGTYGSILHGVTWMSADTTPRKSDRNAYVATTWLISHKDNSTLLALWRTYSSLDQHITSSGQTSLPPPTRLFFPQVRVFTDPNPLPHFHMIRRRRVDTGFHPFLLKAAFPQLTVLYQEDWEDYHKLPIPFLVERLVVADREAAEAAIKRDQPVFSPAFNLPGSKHWWEPVRRTLLSFLSEPPSKKKTVTYLHRQSENAGVRLRDEDHKALVLGLKKLERDYGYEIHIVSSSFDETDWFTRMSAISKSTVLLGPYGSDLLDCLFMKPSPETTLVEIFPSGTFARDEELVARSINVHYIAWWNDRKFMLANLPNESQPSNTQEARVDVAALTKVVRETLAR
ncbi:hypothetical protein C0992_002428 [Termitomyces sp. T32_za158]|nr:hypothetical protein C0992_002428 [Termitomyces sp. T32_za158]